MANKPVSIEAIVAEIKARDRLAAIAAQTVPAPMSIVDLSACCDIQRALGWNDCRDAMLAAATELDEDLHARAAWHKAQHAECCRLIGSGP